MTGASVGVSTTENYIFPITQLVLYSNHRDEVTFGEIVLTIGDDVEFTFEFSLKGNEVAENDISWL